MKKYLLTTAILVLLVLASGLVSAGKSADEVNELLKVNPLDITTLSPSEFESADIQVLATALVEYAGLHIDKAEVDTTTKELKYTLSAGLKIKSESDLNRYSTFMKNLLKQANIIEQPYDELHIPQQNTISSAYNPTLVDAKTSLYNLKTNYEMALEIHDNYKLALIIHSMAATQYYNSRWLSNLDLYTAGFVAAKARFSISDKISDEERASIKTYFKKIFRDNTIYRYNYLSEKQIDLLDEYFYNVEIKTDYNVLSGNGPRDFKSNEIMVIMDYKHDGLLQAITFGDGIDLVLRNHETLPEGTKLLIQKGGQYAGTDQFFTKVQIKYPDGKLEIFSATNEDGGAVEFNFLKKPKPQFVSSEDEQEKLKELDAPKTEEPQSPKITEPSNDDPAKGPIVISNLKCGEAITDTSFGGLDEITVIQNMDCGGSEYDFFAIDVKEDGKKIYIKDSNFLDTRLTVLNGDVTILNSKFVAKDWAITIARGKLTIKDSEIVVTTTLTNLEPSIAMREEAEMYVENSIIKGGMGVSIFGGKAHFKGGLLEGKAALQTEGEVILEDVELKGITFFTVAVAENGVLTVGENTNIRGAEIGIAVSEGGALNVYHTSNIQGREMGISLADNTVIEFYGGVPTLQGATCLIEDHDNPGLLFTADSEKDRKGIINRYDCWTKIVLQDGIAKPIPQVQGPPEAPKKKAPVVIDKDAPAQAKSATPEATAGVTTTVIKKADPDIREPGDIIKKKEAEKKEATENEEPDEPEEPEATDEPEAEATGETISSEAAALFTEMATAQKELNRIYTETNKIDNDQYKLVKDAETKLKDEYGINARDVVKFPRAKDDNGKFVSWDTHWQTIAENNVQPGKEPGLLKKIFSAPKKLIVKIFDKDKELVVKAEEEVVIASEEDTVASEADKEKEKVTGVKTKYTKKQRKLFAALGDLQAKINMGDLSNETIAKRDALKQKLIDQQIDPDKIPAKKGQTMDDVWLDIGKGVDVEKTIEKLQAKVDEYENKKDTSRLYILLDKKGDYHLVSGEQEGVSYEVDTDSGYLVIHAEKMTKETLLSVNKEVSKSLLKNIFTLNAPWLGRIKIREDGTIPLSAEMSTGAPNMKIITSSGVYYLEDEVVDHWVSAAKEYKKVEALQKEINDLKCAEEWNKPAPTVNSRECDKLAIERDKIYLSAAKKLSKSLLYAKIITEEEYDALINKYEIFLKPDSELTVEEVNQKARILRGAEQLIKPEAKALKLEGLTIEVEPENAVLYKKLGEWQKKINDLEKKVSARDGKYTTDEQKEWAGYVKERDASKKTLRVDKKDPWVDFFPGRDKATGKKWTRENWWTYLGSTAPEPKAFAPEESKPAEFLAGEEGFTVEGDTSFAVQPTDSTKQDTIKVDQNAKKCKATLTEEPADTGEPSDSTATDSTLTEPAMPLPEKTDQCFYTPACGEYITDSTFEELGIELGVIVINEDMDCGQGQAVVVNIADQNKAVLVHSAKIEGGMGIILMKGNVHVYDSTIVASLYAPISIWDGELTIRDTKVITGSTAAGIWHQDGTLTIKDNVEVLGGDIGIWSEDGKLKAIGNNLKVEATKVAVLIDPDFFNAYSVWSSGFANGDLKAKDCLIKTYGYGDALVDNFESKYDRTIDDGGWFGLEYDCWKAKGTVEEEAEEEIPEDCGRIVNDDDFEHGDTFVIDWDLKCGEDKAALIVDFDHKDLTKTLIVRNNELEGAMGIMMASGNVKVENAKIKSTKNEAISVKGGVLSLADTEVATETVYAGIVQEFGELSILDNVKVKGGRTGIVSEKGKLFISGENLAVEAEEHAVILNAVGDILDPESTELRDHTGLYEADLKSSECLIKAYDLESFRDDFEPYYDYIVDDGGILGPEFDCWKAEGSYVYNEESTPESCGRKVTDEDFQHGDQFIINWDLKCGEDATALILDYDDKDSTRRVIVKDNELEGIMGVLLKKGTLVVENAKISSTKMRGISMWDGSLSIKDSEVISGSQEAGIFQEAGTLKLLTNVKVKGGDNGIVSRKGIFHTLGNGLEVEADEVAVLLDPKTFGDMSVIAGGLENGALQASECLIKTYFFPSLRDNFEPNYDLVVDDGGLFGWEFDCWKAKGSVAAEAASAAEEDNIAESLDNMPEALKDTKLYNRYQTGQQPVQYRNQPKD